MSNSTKIRVISKVYPEQNNSNGLLLIRCNDDDDGEADNAANVQYAQQEG